MKILNVVFGLLLVGNAYADTVDLPEIVVTPFRYDETLAKTPTQVTVISQEDIKQSNASKVLDVLRTVPGVTVRDLFANGAQTAVDMSGFGEQAALNVLVLVDGRRVNNPDLSGVDWNQIPLDQVERIEIVHGGAMGVLYGDNASSGVINIITKKGSAKTQGAVSTEIGSYARTKQSVAVSGQAIDKLLFNLTAGRESTNGYRHNSYYKAQDYSLKTSYALTDALNVHFDSGFHAASYGMPGAVFQNNRNLGAHFFGLQNTLDDNGRRTARFGEDHTNNKDYYLMGGAEHDLGEMGKISADFSYRRADTDSYFLTSGLYTRRNKITTYGLTPKYTLDHSIADHNNKFVVGSDLYKVFFHSDNLDSSDVLQNLTKITKTSMAGYVQDEFSITDPLVLIGGYRYEQARYAFNYHDFGLFNPDQDAKQSPSSQLFNSGLVYSYAQDSNVFFNASKSFRFPEVDEFTYQDSGFLQQLNTNLKPQTAINYQAGVRHRFTPAVKGEVSVYRQNVRHEIYFNATGGAFGAGQNENYDRTVHQGVDVSSEAKITDWMTLMGNYTFTDAYFANGTYKKKEIPMVPRHKAGAGVKFLMPAHLTLNVMDNYVGPRYFLNDQANRYSRLNEYMTLDSNISWGYKDWTVTLGVNNLLDRQYAEFAGVRQTNDSLYGYRAGDKFYYPSPERNFNLKVDYKF